MPQSLSLQQLPFSQACDNNKQPILTLLAKWFANRHHILEIGSGTGQHSVYFAKNLAHLRWQPSDQQHYLPTLQTRLNLQASPNLQPAITLDVTQPWPQFTPHLDAIFSANTLHIMSQTMVEAFFGGIGSVLTHSGSLVIYGPFKYQGQFTSDSNRQFNLLLQQNNPHSGIRDIEWIGQLALQQGLTLQEDIAMPANNRMLHFIK
ncbi:MAG: cyclopropane fatty-acyl-phospholipid synthase-like methyltransferase [Shewanella psychromarinicola]|jgi:cyclopropane fatty-acyl-phospholipid synthase-like methyltransferase